jgi:hypothetical protein
MRNRTVRKDRTLGRVSPVPAQDEAQGLRFLARVEALADRLERMADQAEARGDRADFRHLARESRGFLELVGKLTGVLRSESSVQAVKGLLARVGAQSEEELRKLVEERRALEGYGLDEAEHDCVEGLRLVLSEHPDRATRIRRELFGE